MKDLRRESREHSEQEDLWVDKFLFARQRLVEETKGCTLVNTQLKETSELLLEQCDEQRVVTGRKRRTLDVAPLTFETIPDLADIYQERCQALSNKLKEYFAEVTAHEEDSSSSYWKVDDDDNNTNNNQINRGVALSVDELDYDEDREFWTIRYESSKRPLEVKKITKDAEIVGTNTAEIEMAIEEAKKNRSESFDFFLNQLSYEETVCSYTATKTQIGALVSSTDATTTSATAVVANGETTGESELVSSSSSVALGATSSSDSPREEIINRNNIDNNHELVVVESRMGVGEAASFVAMTSAAAAAQSSTQQKTSLAEETGKTSSHLMLAESTAFVVRYLIYNVCSIMLVQ